jgi:hypothetical protein
MMSVNRLIPVDNQNRRGGLEGRGAELCATMVRSGRCQVGRILWKVALIAVGILALVPNPAVARDFPEPPEIADPWLAVSQEQSPATAAEAGRKPLLLAPAASGDIGYHDYALLDGPNDSFSVRSRMAGVPLVVGPVALGVYWSSYLLVGPIVATDDPASVAEWWMNAVQFEYGLIAATRLPEPFRSATVEYGRTSQHPLRAGFSEIASDVIRCSVWFMTFRPDRLFSQRSIINLGIAVSWIDLYDFWGSDLLRPRTRVRAAVPYEVTLDLVETGAARLQLFAAGEPRLLVLRSAEVQPGTDLQPGVQLELDAELGLRVRGHARLDLALEIFTTRDSEQRRDEASPLTSLGFVIRTGS